jgi:hypothetical protein
MQALRLPAQRGWAWLTEGFALFLQAPAALGMLAFGYLLLLLLLGLIPILGQILTPLLMPALSVGILTGCQQIARQQTVSPMVLLTAFRGDSRGLIVLGATYLGASLVLLLLLSVIDGGTMLGLVIGQRQMSPEIADDSRVFLAALLGTLISTPLMMGYWFAPLLVSWGKLPPAKAFFFSLIACWRNWPAFLVYGLGLAGIVISAGFVLGFVSLVSQTLGGLLGLMLPLILIPVLFTSFFINARDIFGELVESR